MQAVAEIGISGRRVFDFGGDGQSMKNGPFLILLHYLQHSRAARSLSTPERNTFRATNDIVPVRASKGVGVRIDLLEKCGIHCSFL